jgi:hypothetical protein
MSVKEIILYRTPQFISTKFVQYMVYRFSRSKSSDLKRNTDFRSTSYDIDQIHALFKESPWQPLYSYFGATVNIEEDIRWRKDYKNNIESGITYSGNIKKQNKLKYGDLKYVFELSRMHFLPFMAFNYISTKNAQDLHHLTNTVLNWEKENPYLGTINYISGIEVGIRVTNLIYTHNILFEFDELTDDLDQAIKRIISQSHHFLCRHLSRYSSANNHYVGELLGLVVISSYFTGKGINKKKWEQRLIQCLINKFKDDGVDDELSMRYHMAVSDHFLNSLLFLERSGSRIPEKVKNTLEMAFDFIDHIHYQNIESNFGDNDNSFLINPFFDPAFSLSKSLKDSNNYFYDKLRSSGNCDFRNYLIFGKEYYNAKTSKESVPQSYCYDTSGYAFLYDHDENLKLVYDTGPIGDNKLMAHGHSDQLSFTLQKNGMPVLVDPGTYQYHQSEIKWRQYFRGIKAHNTISVNDCDHAVSLNRMSWCKPSKLLKREFRSIDNLDEISASIDAFQDQGVNYCRRLSLDKNSKTVIIKDELKIVGNVDTKKASLYLHFHPKVQPTLKGNQIIATLEDGSCVRISNEKFDKAELIKGDENEPMGWFSESYDNIEESYSLVLNIFIEEDITLTTKIEY